MQLGYLVFIICIYNLFIDVTDAFLFPYYILFHSSPIPKCTIPFIPLTVGINLILLSGGIHFRTCFCVSSKILYDLYMAHLHYASNFTETEITFCLVPLSLAGHVLD